MLVEPPPVAADARQRTRSRAHEASEKGVRVSTRSIDERTHDPSAQRLRAGLVAAALAACVAGLLGADAGILWIVAGVWTVRAVWGSPPGFAWGIVCLGAGARWGTLSASDVEVSARTFGPSVATGPLAVRAGLCVALLAALVSESRIDGLRAESWAERLAAAIALLSLVVLLLAPGAGGSRIGPPLGVWAVAGAAIVTACLGLSARAKRAPGWLSPAAAAVAVVFALVLS